MFRRTIHMRFKYNIQEFYFPISIQQESRIDCDSFFHLGIHQIKAIQNILGHLKFLGDIE